MIKSDGSPTYNFCCVVDDSAQGVTHILRGDDHISNTPKQILFYEALGKALPKFCHIPLVMGADGAKLSKRHGAVSVEEYKNEGFLPEALVNYLLLLGWSPKDGKEVLSMKEAIELFDEKDMGGVQSRFDLQKLRWLNAEHIMKISDIDIEPLLIEQFKAAGIEVNTAMLKKLVPLYKVRAKTLKEFVELTECFFKDDHAKDPEAYKKNLSTDESRTLLKEYSAVLEALPDFKAAAIEKSCQDFAAAKGVKGGKIIHPVRVAISGKTIGAGLFEMMEVMGKGTVIKRINEAAK
jgi:glutamyl-tRNA synthetase